MTVKKILTGLPLVLLALLIVSFIVANRGGVTISLWPLPYLVDMPLYLVFFAGLFAGLALAGIIGAVKRAQSFSSARRAEKESRRLRAEVDALEQELDSAAPPDVAPGAGEATAEPAEIEPKN